MRNGFKGGYSMKILITALLLLGFTHIVQAEPPADVDGWNKLKWGMTEAEVAAAFPNAAPFEHPNSSKCMRAIDPEDVLGYQFRIVLIFDCETKTLSNVSMGPSGLRTRVVAVGIMEKVLDELKAKYGPPTKTKQSKTGATFTWIFPSTKIEMTLLAPSADTAFLDITYDMREGEDML